MPVNKVSGESLILTNDGLLLLNELVDKKNVDVVGYNNKKNVITNIKYTGKCESIRILLYDGRMLDCTKESKILTYIGNDRFVSKRAGELNNGDKLVVSIGNNIWPNNISKIKLSQCKNKTYPRYLTSDLSKMFGLFFVFNRKFSHTYYYAVFDSKEKIDYFYSLYTSIFNTRPKTYQKDGLFFLCLYNHSVVKYIKDTCCQYKEVPYFLRTANRIYVASFIRGMMSSGYDMHRKYKCVCLCRNRKLAQQIQLLLNNDGVNAYIEKCNHKNDKKLQLNFKFKITIKYGEISDLNKMIHGHKTNKYRIMPKRIYNIYNINKKETYDVTTLNDYGIVTNGIITQCGNII